MDARLGPRMTHSTTIRLLGASLFIFSSFASSQLPVVNNSPGPMGAEVGPSTGNRLVVNQHENRAIVHWDSFSIGEGYEVHFEQEQHQAILNRVGVSGGRSDLLGTLTAGGTVWLINPNGVLIGNGARIETQSFIASTLNVADEQFLNNERTISFAGDSEKSIQNLGSITAQGGDVILIAQRVHNAGQIQAAEGVVGLAAGNDIELTLQDARSSWLSPIKVKPALDAPLGGDGVNHQGVIAAARAELAAAGGNIYGMAVNVSGGITAQGTAEYEPIINLASEGGSVTVGGGAQLRAEAGTISIDTAPSTVSDAGGDITIAGRLDASAAGESDNWSSIFIAGDRVQLRSTAVIDASGEIAGGFIDIRSVNSELMTELKVERGAVLRANGVEGQIYLEAADMLVAGELEALGNGAGITIASADWLNAADARIRTNALSLENVLSADISNTDNRFGELMLIMWARDEPSPDFPGSMVVNSGSGTLDVYGEGAVRYKNLTLISEDDLSLGEYAASIGVSEQAVLASLQGKLQIDLPDGGGLADTRRVRLYSREESQLNGIEPDNIVADVVFPADPDGDNRVVLYRIVDAPEPEPSPIPEPQPAQQRARETHDRDSAHQQQANRGTHFIVGVNPATGLPRLVVGSSGSRIGISDNPPGEEPPSAPIYPSQQVSVPTGTEPNDGGAPGMDEDFLKALLDGSPSDVIAALLENKAKLDAENAAFLESLRSSLEGDQDGSGLDLSDEEALERYRQNVENVLYSLLRDAAGSGLVDAATIQSIIDEANRSITDRARNESDRGVPPIDRSAGVDPELEQRRQEQRQQAEQRRQEQQQQQQDRREQAEQNNRELIAQLERRRQELEEANRQAEERARQAAEERYRDNLNDDQRRALEERLAGRDQERQRQQQQPSSPSARPAPGNDGGTSGATPSQPPQSSPSPQADRAAPRPPASPSPRDSDTWQRSPTPAPVQMGGR